LILTSITPIAIRRKRLDTYQARREVGNGTDDG
jgi:hypothetical protein